jgi:hypothetical protein
MGDRHVYGAKSRFLTAPVMRCFESVSCGQTIEEAGAVAGEATLDVGARLRSMW